VALEIVKDAILKGPAAMSMLVKFIEAHEARQAARGAEGQVGGRLPG
jgi:hypothetical protein